MVKMLCDIDLRYKGMILYTRDGRRIFLYGKLMKAVHGMILGANLFYNKLSEQFNKWGFEKNPYDKCTFNNTVQGKQFTVQLHVDDIIANHKD